MSVKPTEILQILNLKPIEEAEILPTLFDRKEQNNEGGESRLKQWMSLFEENIAELITQAENQAWPFLPPHVTPEMLASPNNKVSTYNNIELLYYCLHEAVQNKNYKMAAAIAFVVDRAAYRFGSSRSLLRVIDLILNEAPHTPVAPQVVLRKARIMKDTGDLHGAVKVLDAVVSKERQWDYKTEDQYTNVKAVCVQVKGQILHNLGLWKEAIEPLVQSIESFKYLHDNKGTSSSLGLLCCCFKKLSQHEFKEVKQKFPHLFQSQHPCYEAYRQGTEAVSYIRDLGQTLYLCKHQLLAEESLLIFAMQAPGTEYQCFETIVHGVRGSLAGHQTVNFLKSAETFTEFIRGLFVISLTLWFSPKEQDRALSKYLEQLCLELYHHLAQHTEDRVEHTKESVKIMNTGLGLLGLPPLLGSEEFDIELSLLKAAVQSEDLERKIKKDENSNNQNESKGNLAEPEHKEKCEMKLGAVKSEEAVKIGNPATHRETTSSHNMKMPSTFPLTTSEIKYKFPRKSQQKFVGVPVTHEELLSFCSTTTSEENESDPEAEESVEVVNLSVTHISQTAQTMRDDCSSMMDKSKILQSNLNTSSSVSGKEEACGQNSAEASKKGSSSGTHITEEESSFEKMSTAEIKGSSSKSNTDEQVSSSADTSSGRSASLVSVDKAKVSSLETSNSSEMSPLVDLSCSTVDSQTLDSLSIGESVDSGSDLEDYLKKWRPPTSDGDDVTKVYRGVLMSYHPNTGDWTQQSTLVYRGSELDIPDKKKGNCRDVFHIQFLHQDEPLGKYVCKRYRKQREPERYILDVQCQMRAGYYVTKFNQGLQNYKKDIQVQYLPAAHLQILTPDGEIKDWVNVEPFLSGSFEKLTNNLDQFSIKGRELATALSHFSYCESKGELMIVDLQGWLPSDDSGIIYLTDPLFNTQGPERYGPYDQQEKGMAAFWSQVHPECNDICRHLRLCRPE